MEFFVDVFQVAVHGLDTDGDRLANGVYLYRLKVTTLPTDGAESESFETIEKVAIVR